MARKKDVPVKRESKSGAEAPPPAPLGGDAWRPLAELRRDMDRLFEDFASGFSLRPFGRDLFHVEPSMRLPTPFGRGAPAVDVVEKDKAFEITAELPGLDIGDVTLEVSDDLLTLHGEKKAESEEKKEGYYHSERSYGSFHRSFRLPDSVDKSKIDASFDQGVLTISLPKTAEAQKEKRKITVKKGGGKA
jgi:HSP20 family protein